MFPMNLKFGSSTYLNLTFIKKWDFTRNGKQKKLNKILLRIEQELTCKAALFRKQIEF